MVSAEEVNLLCGVESLIGQKLVRKVVAGFVPTHQVPLSCLVKVRPKKPKKNKLRGEADKCVGAPGVESLKSR